MASLRQILATSHHHYSNTIGQWTAPVLESLHPSVETFIVAYSHESGDRLSIQSIESFQNSTLHVITMQTNTNNKHGREMILVLKKGQRQYQNKFILKLFSFVLTKLNTSPSTLTCYLSLHTCIRHLLAGGNIFKVQRTGCRMWCEIMCWVRSTPTNEFFHSWYFHQTVAAIAIYFNWGV